MEGKKISFGFKKVKKVEKPVVEEQKDFIECVEEKSIKVVGGEKATEKEPLIIPMKPNTLITAEKLKEIAAKVESSLDEPMDQKETKVDIKIEPVENESLDQMAVRELLQEAKKEVKVETQALTVPIPAKPVIDGQKESSLDDYEAVPIQDFGLAMLRGMGWTPDQEKANKYKQPQLRPKGLGLGADKVISDKQKKKTANKDGKEEELAIVKNSCVKIVAGKYCGYYGKVVSLDEENGRVMVEITIKKETVSLSEFMMQPVTKAEFDKESKVINMDAYEEYKKREQSQDQKSSHNSPQVSNISRQDSPKVNDKEASSSKQDDSSKEKEKRRDKSSNGRDRRRERRDSLGSEDKSKKRDSYKRDSSSLERDNRRTERHRRERSKEDRRKTEKSEERDNRKKDKSKRNSSEERSRRKNKEKSKRDSSASDYGGRRNYKHKSKRDASENRESKRQKEKSRRDPSEEDGSRKKKERDRKKYSSNDSINSLSDTEKKKNYKNCRRQKDSSDSESDPPKKDKRDIDKKRKGKKKRRDRDRSPNYKKHRK